MRLLAVFQPHRCTRTRALIDDFPPAFRAVEKLWLLPVYAASEQPVEGGTTKDLIGRFPESGKKRIKYF
jgi:UDP-N-acetylmuramate--alanine ligase